MRPKKMNLCSFRVRRLKRSQPKDKKRREESGDDKIYEGNDNDPTTWEVFRAQIAPMTFEQQVKASLGNVPKSDGHLTYRVLKNDGTLMAPLQDGDRIVGQKNIKGDWDARDWKIVGEAMPTMHTGGAPNGYISKYKQNDEVTVDTAPRGQPRVAG